MKPLILITPPAPDFTPPRFTASRPHAATASASPTLWHRIGSAFWFGAFLVLTAAYFVTHPSAWKRDMDAANDL